MYVYIDGILSQDFELDQFTNMSFGKKDRHELTTSVEDSFFSWFPLDPLNSHMEPVILGSPRFQTMSIAFCC